MARAWRRSHRRVRRRRRHPGPSARRSPRVSRAPFPNHPLTGEPDGQPGRVGGLIAVAQPDLGPRSQSGRFRRPTPVPSERDETRGVRVGRPRWPRSDHPDRQGPDLRVDELRGPGARADAPCHGGDVVRFTLTNAGAMQHSIDFHAAQTPWSKNYQAVDPGTSFSFDSTARHPGVFMYHCGTPPVSMHIGDGMYGAVIVDPKDGRPPPASSSSSRASSTGPVATTTRC